MLCFWGQKVKIQGLVVQKHIEGDRVAGVSYAVYRVPTSRQNPVVSETSRTCYLSMVRHNYALNDLTNMCVLKRFLKTVKVSAEMTLVGKSFHERSALTLKRDHYPLQIET